MVSPTKSMMSTRKRVYYTLTVTAQTVTTDTPTDYQPTKQTKMVVRTWRKGLSYIPCQNINVTATLENIVNSL